MTDAYKLGKKQWTSRIVGHDVVDADQLLANPLNARIHGKLQQDATAGNLDALGFVKSVVVNRTTGHVVDGHLRVTLALRNGSPVPVEYVDLTEAEEAQALATLDPLTELATYDAALLDALLREVQTDDAALQQMLAELAEGLTIPADAAWADGAAGLPTEDHAPFQQMTFTLHDTQAEQVKRAITAAGQMSDYADSPNQNGNGNALAFICETFVTEHGQS